MTLTAISSGNVHVDRPIPTSIGNRLSSFTYEDMDESHVLVKSVPIFDEHKENTRIKPFDNMTGKAFDQVYRVTKDSEERGSHIQIIPGHTDPGDSDLDRTPVGHVRNLRMTGKEGDRLIIGDFVFDSGFFYSWVKTNKLPRRSVEISRNSLRIGQVSLLGARTPARPLPDMIFSKYEQTETYCDEWLAGTHYQESNKMNYEEEIKNINEKLSQLSSKFQQYMDDQSKKEDEKEEKKADHKEPDGDEKNASSESTEQYKQITDQLESLRKENKALKESSVKAEVDAKIEKFVAFGVTFGNEKELKDVKESLYAMDDKGRVQKYAEIEKYWSRVPVGQRIDRSGLTNPAPATKNNRTDVAMDKAARDYAKEHGITLSEAYDEMSTNGSFSNIRV